MSAMRTGIYNHFATATLSDLYSDLDGERLYYEEAPEQPIIPYCIFRVFEKIPSHTFDLHFEEILLQFDYYGSTIDMCDNGVVNIETLYDFANLVISGYTFLKFEKELVFDPVRILPHDIWQSSVRYSLLIQN